MSKIIKRLPILLRGGKSKEQDGDGCHDVSGPSNKRSSSVLTFRSSFLSFPCGGGDQQQPFLRRLVRGEKWGDLAKFLDTEEGRRQVVAETAAAPNEPPEDTVLHLACRYGAPLYVFERLCELNADLVCSVGARGRTPLHVAAERWCLPQIVRFLLNESFHGRGAVLQCAETADDDARTPLHLACRGDEDYWNEFVEGGKPPAELVYELCRCYPTAVNREDLDGRTPLEYAIECEAGYGVVKLLRKASEADWKRRVRVPQREAVLSRSPSAQSPQRKSNAQAA